jgi:type II secretory pathway component PulC
VTSATRHGPRRLAGIGIVLVLGIGHPAAAQESVRLAATLVTAEGASALLEAGTTQAWLRPGQMIADCRVDLVSAASVRLICAGEQRELRLQPGARGAARPRGTPAMDSVTLPPGALQALAARPQAIALGLDVAPVVEDGVLRGWQVARLDERGALAGFGLKESDLVVAVDGAFAAEPAAFAAALRALPRAGVFTLELLRHGQPLTLHVSAPPARTH